MNVPKTSGNIRPVSAPPHAHEIKATFLYILEGKGGIKIGISKRPKRRMTNIQQSTPTTLRLYATFKPTEQSALDIERRLKRDLLAPWKIRGEWFSCPAEIARIAAEALINGDADKQMFIRRYVEFSAVEARCEDSRDEADFALFASIGDELVASHRDLMGRVNIWNLVSAA